MAAKARPRAADLHPAATLPSGERLRLVKGATGEAAGRLAAEMLVSADGGPIRTVIGDAHRHFVGEEPSQKTGLSNPYEGPTEHALVVESELRADVPDYRTQAFRLRLLVGSVVREWICDHLRVIRRDGIDVVEAIECKPDPSYVDADERAVQAAAARVIKAMGWRHRLIYLRDVLGPGERQINHGEIFSNRTTHVPDDRLHLFERMSRDNPDVTFRELREAMHPDRVQGTARAHALICLGRVQVDLDRYLFDPVRIRLLPPPALSSAIRF